MDDIPRNPVKYDADVKKIALKIQEIIREQFDYYMVGHDTDMVEQKLHWFIEASMNAPINRCKTCNVELPRNNPPEFCQKCSGPDLTTPTTTDWGAPNPAWDEWH